jgi:YgiT-type zinc finger domain-containing protein
MKRTFPSGLCALCGGGRAPGRVSYTVDVGTTVVVVRNVPATVCDQCGESWFDDGTVQHLGRIVDDARQRGAQVEVVSLP